jgi:uncharacterized lipoprotein YmbA
MTNTNLHSGGDRGGSEEPTQAYLGVRRGERRSDNEGIHVKANWYTSATYEKAITLCLLTVLLVLGGCVTSPSSRFYTLSSVTPRTIPDPVVDKTPKKIIGIASVEIPDYLDRPELATRSSQNRLSLAEFDLWGGSLKVDIHRVLAEDLSMLLSQSGFSIVSWRPGVLTNYRVTFHVTRFDIRPGRDVLLTARWTLSDKDGKTNLLMSSSTVTEPIRADDLTDAVLAMSNALGRLSEEVAGKVRSLQ